MGISDETDGQLLSRFAAARDHDAFEQLVRRHAAMVYRVCARLCRTPHDAEDATQSVFLTLAERAGPLGGRTCVAGWLHRTARHTALRSRRGALTRLRHERVAGELRPDYSEGEAGLVPGAVEFEDERGRLDRALGALPEDYRDALILHHLEGHTVEQVAALLATRPGTVAARLSRGRAMLRERLGAWGVGVAAPAIDRLLADAPPVHPHMNDELASAIGRSLAGATAPGAAAKAPGITAGVTLTAAAPATVWSHVKAAVLLFGLSTSACTAGAGAAYYVFGDAPAAVPADGSGKGATPEPPRTPAGSSAGWSAHPSVPEPSGILVIAPIALLLRRRRRSG
jgi:RNA polymerase sigma factor (sigma-70 family)